MNTIKNTCDVNNTWVIKNTCDKDDFSAEIENNNYCVCCDSVKTVAGNICLRYLKLVIKTSDKIFNFILSIQPKYPYCTGICKECITLNNTLNTTIETIAYY